MVYINPGHNYQQIINYIKSGAVDVTNIHEMESSKSHYILVNDNLPPSKISVVLSNITDVQEMKTKLMEIASKGIVYLYSSSYDSLHHSFQKKFN